MNKPRHHIQTEKGELIVLSHSCDICGGIGSFLATNEKCFRCGGSGYLLTPNGLSLLDLVKSELYSTE